MTVNLRKAIMKRLKFPNKFLKEKISIKTNTKQIYYCLKV